MGQSWQLQEAKNELSELADEALVHGPQVITRRGAATAVVLSWVNYQQLLSKQQKLSDFFRESPLAGLDLDLTRDPSPLRDDRTL